jgi:hypothetical protein
MSLRRVSDLKAVTNHFLTSHRNCPVEITIYGFNPGHLAGSCGRLRCLKLLKKQNHSAELYVSLDHADGSTTVMLIPAICSCDATERQLTFDCDNGVRRNLECLSIHSVVGRDKLLLIRHLALMPQGAF